MPKFNLPPLQIALWGPPDSGKTRLKDMLLDSLLQSYQHPILEIFIEQDAEQQNVDDGNLLDREYWTFWNIGRKVKNVVDHNKAGVNVSSMYHDLEIFDPPGGRVFRSNNHPSPYEKADLVILVLDPTQSSFSKKDGSFLTEQYSYPAFPKRDKEDDVDLSEFVKQSIFFQTDPIIGQKTAVAPAQEEVFDYIEQVRTLLRTRRNTEKLVAVCITKMDLLPISDRQLEPKMFLQQYFGEGMALVLSQKSDLNIGFYSIPTSDDKFTEPYSTNKKPRPKSLVIPVLKLLEARECEQIEEQSNWLSKKYNLKNYIPYLENGSV